MAWRIAPALETLREQLNAAFPKRSKVSDGGIGDAGHASRSSDHNPWVIDSKGKGVVTARDFTHDPATGIDCQWLADTLVANKDSRIKYIIWRKQICSSKQSPWKWRPYKGTNAHTKHLHISVSAEPKLYDSKKAWVLDFPNDKTDDVAKVDTNSAAVSTSAPSAERPQSPAIPSAGTQPPINSETKVEVSAEGDVKVEQSTAPDAPKERIAVVKTAPQKWMSRVTAKITAAVTGSALFQWLWAQTEKIQGLSVPDAVWIIVSVTIAVGSLLWVIHEIVDTWRTNNNQERIDELLVKENSTANNLVQLIPSDEVELYRARGFKIITRGEKA